MGKSRTTMWAIRFSVGPEFNPLWFYNSKREAQIGYRKVWGCTPHEMGDTIVRVVVTVAKP